MSAKGLSVTAFKYVECEMTVGGITKDWRFILLNIAEDVVLGRDFMREHKVLMEFNPDRFVVRDREGSTPSPRQPKRRLAHLKEKRRIEMLTRTAAASPYSSDTPPAHERKSEPEPLKLRPYELLSYSSKLISREQGDVLGWIPPREVIDEFKNELVEYYWKKGTILRKKSCLARRTAEHSTTTYRTSRRTRLCLRRRRTRGVELRRSRCSKCLKAMSEVVSLCPRLCTRRRLSFRSSKRTDEDAL
jgi:hypothetical protein